MRAELLHDVVVVVEAGVRPQQRTRQVGRGLRVRRPAEAVQRVIVEVGAVVAAGVRTHCDQSVGSGEPRGAGPATSAAARRRHGRIGHRADGVGDLGRQAVGVVGVEGGDPVGLAGGLGRRRGAVVVEAVEALAGRPVGVVLEA